MDEPNTRVEAGGPKLLLPNILKQKKPVLCQKLN